MIRYIKALFGKYDHNWTEFESNWFSVNSGDFSGSGLTPFFIGNDWHYGSEYQDNPDVEHWTNRILGDVIELHGIILNGDIIDLACCKKEDVPRLRDLQKKLIDKLGKNYNFGNHERSGTQDYHLVKKTKSGKNVFFHHGDLYGDSAHKWSAYRLKEQGSTKLGLLKTKLFDQMDWIKGKRPLPKNYIEDLTFEMTEFGYDIAVVGHFHVEKARRYEYQGKVIIILPAHQISEVWL